MQVIVVGVDGSESSQEALRWAVDEARLRRCPVQAVLARTFPYTVPVLGNLSEPRRARLLAEEYLAVVVRESLRGVGDVEVILRVEEGSPAGVLLEAARDASLLVVGSRGRGGLASAVLGSVSQQCVHHARCPVAVVRHEDAAETAPRQERAPRRIVVGVDGSEQARIALDWAVQEALRQDAVVEVVHAWQTPYVYGYPWMMADVPAHEAEEDARQVLDSTVGRLDTAGEPRVEPILVCDRPVRALLDTAKGADLLVVGSRGRGGFAGLLLGSVSQAVLHHATCPVVVVPTPPEEDDRA